MFQFIDWIIDFMEEHQTWAIVLVFFVTFIECFFIIGLFIPAATILLAVGALVGATDINFFLVSIAAIVGSITASSISYQIGKKIRPGLRKRRIYQRHRKLFLVSKILLSRYGAKAVFIGRFISPLRPTLATAAGAFQMKQLHFEIANVTSSILWPLVFLLPGYLIVH
ncbi:MAG: DedA family protein [Alcaligenaceae bacterium]|jgi:membrane protein DedA with SNARE-associated domain|nr:DedA family protein [Alcaligenaceae bacterium]HZJ96986.1 DedA family protein [Oligella sp.]